MDNATIQPVSLQIELHAYLQQTELVEFCKTKNIIVTAYSPLGSKGIGNFFKSIGQEYEFKWEFKWIYSEIWSKHFLFSSSFYRRTVPELLDIPEINAIATRLGKTPAQILLKWIVQRGIVAIPKSTNATRLRQNLELFDFDLTDADMETIKGLNKDIRIVNFDFFQGYEYHSWSLHNVTNQFLLNWIECFWFFIESINILNFHSNCLECATEKTNLYRRWFTKT